MKILVLETSSEDALIAVLEEGRALDLCRLAGGPLLSKSLGMDVKQMIDKHPPPYGRIVLGVGPGSFTGVRVGAAMAQALAFGWGVPLYTSSSLNAFAPAANTTAAIAIDARSGGIYVQMGFTKPQLLALAEAASFLQKAPLIASPHPSRITQRLPNLLDPQWIETRPNPLLLALHAVAAPSPLILDYLSSP